MSRRFHRWIAISTCWLSLVPGCVSSEHSFSDDESSVIDPALLGEWRLETQAPDTSFFVRAKPDSKRVLQFGWDNQHGAIDLLVSQIGDRRYLCGVVGDECFIFRYERSGDDKVIAYPLDEAVIHDAIKGGELDGIAYEAFGKQAHIRDTSAALYRYLEKNGENCFRQTSKLTFKRLKP